MKRPTVKVPGATEWRKDARHIVKHAASGPPTPRERQLKRKMKHVPQVHGSSAVTNLGALLRKALNDQDRRH